MEHKKNNLSKKIALIATASLAALATKNAEANLGHQLENASDKTIEIKQARNAKPQLVLKLNFSNPSASKLIAQHSSHSSHSSHGSHSSHSSHSSGAMFA